MRERPRRWTRLGLGAALLGAAGLAACGGAGGDAGETAEIASAGIQPETGDISEGEGGDTSYGVATAEGVRLLSAEKRVAFMSGQVEAGLALYRAGQAEQAAVHLLQPVSSLNASERGGLDALGFKPDAFTRVSTAVEAGVPSEEIEPLLAAAEENITLLQQNAGGRATDLALFLMDVCAEEYQAGVLDSEIIRLNAYQNAYGFAVAARDYASRIEGTDTAALRLELELLVRMWPNDGPVEAAAVAPVATIAAQIARVKLELSMLE